MGCFLSKKSPQPEQNNQSGEKTYSWDNREKVNPADFMVENIEGKEVGRLQGTINGQQFIIQNCKDSKIFLFDYINTITIDDCYNCTIFVGPTTGSLFIRDSSNCIVIASCGQFRTRDCSKLQIHLHCQTQPIIEASTKMKFACFQAYYPELQDQFMKANMSIFNNNWSNIHDFTPVEGENNYTKITPISLDQHLPKTEPYMNAGLSFDERTSVVPYTLGSPNYGSEEAALVLFFFDESLIQRVQHFISQLKKEDNTYKIQHSREIKMEASDAERIFGTQSFKPVVLKGPVVALLIIGDHVQTTCNKLSDESNQTSSLTPASVVLSAHPGNQQIDMFMNYACMSMSI